MILDLILDALLVAVAFLPLFLLGRFAYRR
jgi:hypothetical protein